MHGIPASLKTRKDFENIYNLALSGKVNTKEAVRFFKMLKSNMHYVFDRVLTETEPADGPEPDYKVVETGGERHQYKLETNTAALITKIGYSESEVQIIIDELEVV